MEAKSLEYRVMLVCGIIMAVCSAVLCVKCILSLDLFVSVFWGISAYLGCLMVKEMRREEKQQEQQH